MIFPKLNSNNSKRTQRGKILNLVNKRESNSKKVFRSVSLEGVKSSQAKTRLKLCAPWRRLRFFEIILIETKICLCSN